LAKHFPYLLKGALITLEISAIAIVLGLAGGFILVFLRLSGKKIMEIPSRIFVNVMRGVPFFVQIFIVFYGLANLGLKLSPFASGVLAMALNAAAFQAEILRAGFESIPKGQKEAASALGFTKLQLMRNIVVPQVFMKVLPSLTNDFIVVLKNSSLVSVLAVIELTRVGQQIVSSTYRPTEIYIGVAILYFLMNFAIAQASRYWELRTARYR
jgi:His/Glu/Gln/Arg/opine family amino acid ABC transporter permease subunit